MTKAFDTVWRQGLLLKLIQCGVASNMYKWIKNLLENRTARVKLNGQMSKQVKLKNGVPQGSTISPTLFTIFINDIAKQVGPGVKNSLHADDFAIWTANEQLSTASIKIQESIDRIFKWTEDWGLKINTDKTASTLFTLSTKPEKPVITLNNKTLPISDNPTFLGLTFDKRLTWKNHISQTCTRATKKMSIMKKLAGTTWGANSNILKQLYTGAIRPIIEYASPAWASAAKNNTTILDKVQNQSLRLVLGGMRSTPIKALETQTNCPPLEDRRKMHTFIQYEKSKRIISHPIKNILEDRTKNRLKRNSPNHIAKAAARSHSEISSLKPELLIPNRNTDTDNAKIVKSIRGINTKATLTDPELKNLTLEEIYLNYPPDAWCHIYTDGSAEEATKNGGAGIYIKRINKETESVFFATGETCSNVKAEMVAIHRALQHINNTPIQEQTVIFTDSLTALQIIEGDNKDSITDSVCRELTTISAPVTLQWIPAHCQIHGNEMADALARKGSQLEQPTQAASFSETKTLIKAAWKKTWTADNPSYTYSQDGMSKLPRKAQRAIFRLRTGHNSLNAHLYRIGKANSAECSCGFELQLSTSCRNALFWTTRGIKYGQSLVPWKLNSGAHWLT